jgi:hypothetical protein
MGIQMRKFKCSDDLAKRCRNRPVSEKERIKEEMKTTDRMLERSNCLYGITSSSTRQLKDFGPAGEELGSTLNRKGKVKVLRLDFSWAKDVGVRGFRILALLIIYP